MRRRVLPLALLLLATALVATAASTALPNGPLSDARREFDAGRYSDAAGILRAAIEQNAGDPSLHYWLARCYLEVREFDRAIPSAERAVAIAPENSEYHQWLGRAYGRKAEVTNFLAALSLARKVRREFEEAVRLDPSNLSAQHDLIVFYYRAKGIAGGGDDKALRQIEALAKLDATEAHVARGGFWMDQKKPDQAETEYRQALEARPHRVGPYLEAAEFYVRRNNSAALEEAVEAAARVDGSDLRLSYYRGVARVLAGNRLEEAESLLKNYLAVVPQRSDRPSHSSAHEWLGRLYELQGKREAALGEYRTAADLDPRNKSAREALHHLHK